MSDTLTHQAWTYTSRGSLSKTLDLADVTTPKPGRGQALIKVKAISLNPVDYKLAAFPNWIRRAAGAPSYGSPCVPGMDFAGTVVQVGEGSEWSIGDEVMGRQTKVDGNGTLQRYTLIDASTVCVTKPDNVSWHQAAAIPLVYTTVYGCLVSRLGLHFTRSSPAIGTADHASQTTDSALILGGTSATGLVAIQLAKQLGLAVVTTCSAESRELVEKFGADEVIDYKSQKVSTSAIASRHAPFAVILDCVGGTELMPFLDKLLLTDPTRPNLGQYISIVGDVKDQTDLGVVGTITYRTIRGTLNPYIPSLVPSTIRSWIAGRAYTFYLDEATREALATAPTFLKENSIKVDGVYSFERAKEAFARSESGRAKGKIVIDMV